MSSCITHDGTWFYIYPNLIWTTLVQSEHPAAVPTRRNGCDVYYVYLDGQKAEEGAQKMRTCVSEADIKYSDM